jgi:hypothetical protein
MLGFLFSYWYCKRLNMGRLVKPLDPQPPLFADSGAFTAHTKGEPIDVQDYAAWLHRWGDLFPHYANLDVKGDVDAGLANQATLEAEGLTPIPVFHGGEPWEILQQFVDEGHDYIALGGIAGATMTATNPKVLGWLEHCFETVDGKARLHGFGMTNWSVVERFPWRSVDSSSIGSGYRYGQVSTYDPYTRKWHKWAVKNKQAWGKHGWLAREYGLAPRDFATPRSRDCTRALIRLATRSMAKAIADLPDTTQMYVVDDGGTQAGLRRVEAFNEANKAQVFIADTAMHDLDKKDGLTRADVVNEVNARETSACSTAST